MPQTKISTDHSKWHARTRFDAAHQFTHALAATCDLGVDPAVVDETIECLSASWADVELIESPRWSGLGSDCSGFDASLVLGDYPELRITAEAQAEPPTPLSYWQAAVGLSRELESRFGADLCQYREIENLFYPTNPNAPGVLWHGARFRRGDRPKFKVYFHFSAVGKENALRTAEATFRQLGLGSAFPVVLSTKHERDELLFLSIDLLPRREARIKIYIRHTNITPSELDRIAEISPKHQQNVVRLFAETLVGGRRPIRRGALTCLSFGTVTDEPTVVTHIRLYPHCGERDSVIACRLAKALREMNISPLLYQAALRALAKTDLEQEVGIHSWASLKHVNGRALVSVYFSPRMYLARCGPISLNPARMWPTAVLEEPEYVMPLQI